MGAVPSVDYSALNMLRGLLSEWRSKDLHCLVAEANSMVLELLREQLGHELLQQLPGRELRNVEQSGYVCLALPNLDPKKRVSRQCLTTGSIQSEKSIQSVSNMFNFFALL